MTHIIEGSSHLFTPDYWDGIDITAYEGPMPPLESWVVGGIAENARDTLGEAGEDILDGRCWEETVPLGAPLDSGYADGTIFVVENESVSILYDEAMRICGSNNHSDCLPIEAPYTDYWRKHQDPRNTVRPEFGDELAFHDEQKLVYTRHLDWAVLLTSGRERKLGMWALDELWVSHEGMALKPEKTVHNPNEPPEERALARELFSLDGNVHARGMYINPEYKRGLFKRGPTEARLVAFGLSRVRNISVISTPNGVLPPLPATVEFGDLPQLVGV